MTALTEAQAAVTSAEATMQRIAAEFPQSFAWLLACDRLARAKAHLAEVQETRP